MANISDITYSNVSLNLSANVEKPSDIRFNRDGTKMFISDYGNAFRSIIDEYALSTAFDISTASHTQDLNIVGVARQVMGLTFSTYGTKMFVTDFYTDSIYQYDLTTGFDLSTASYNSVSLDVSAKATSPTGINFNVDGTKMFIVGTDSDSVHQYTLATGFDISTASFNQSLSVSGYSTKPYDIHFTSDGTKMFICDGDQKNIHQWTLGTAYDISTATYLAVGSVSQANNTTGFTINNDGTKLYAIGFNNSSVYTYTFPSSLGWFGFNNVMNSTWGHPQYIYTAVNMWFSDNAQALLDYGHINYWDTSSVNTMGYLFNTPATNTEGRDTFNENISSWNTFNVTNMNNMFKNSAAFNQDIGAWNTSKVTDMNNMFYGANAFNQEIRGWEVSAVTNMNSMFEGANAMITEYTGTTGFGTSPYYTPTAAFFVLPAEIPICFPKGTPVSTNLGDVAIEKLNPDKHTIRGHNIVAITQSRPLQKHIVCFEKDALSKNVPSQQTLCSMEHKVFYKGEMTKARNIVDLCENVTFVDYNGETLFNVLLKKHDKMMINNLICETLHPENIAAKISQMKDGQKKNKAIQELTKIIKENNVPEYQKLYASL
jgi:surface protein